MRVQMCREFSLLLLLLLLLLLVFVAFMEFIHINEVVMWFINKIVVGVN